MDSEIKTRVTPFEELKLSAQGLDCLVVIYSSDARLFGQRHVLEKEPVLLGRGSENTLVLENESVSRKHARIEKRGDHYYVMDLNSTNGTYVNDQMIKDQRLQRGDQVKVGEAIMKFLSGSDVEAQYHETIYRMTIMDGLTAIYNKRYLVETLEREMSRARRHARPLSLVMFDIDYFKKVNDTFGHLAGDYILKEMASVIRARIRPDDVLCRYGGEEFAMVLPETPLEGAVHITEDLRGLVEGNEFVFEGERIDTTVSAGVAEMRDDSEPSQFVKRVDERLYQAKNDGRNCVR